MYRTDGKWGSARRSFSLITGRLPEKLIDDDVDLAAIKRIVSINKDDIYIGHYVYTECTWNCSTKYWEIHITDCSRTESPNVINYRLRRGIYYGFKDTSSLNDYYVNLVSYCSETVGKRTCTFEIKENHITKAISIKDENSMKSKEVLYYDLEANLTSIDAINSKSNIRTLAKRKK